MEEVAVLKREVGGRPGVLNLDFDVVGGRMSAEYDPETIDADAIVSAVAATGMRASPWSEVGETEALSFWEVHGRFVMACASAVLLAAGLVVHAVAHGGFVHALVGGGDGHVFPVASIALYVAAIVTGAWFVAPKALLSARRLRPDMNLLMTVAIIGAAFIGEWFEAATVAFLFAVALLLEHWSVGRARRAISALMELSPTTARYVCPHDGDIEEKDVADVPEGVTVLVRPGERIPLDGVVTKGESSVNQAPITGESIPVAKAPGDDVFAGTINEDGALEFTSTKAANDTTLARIIHMVQDAQSRRAVAEQWVDRFARYYTPIMMALAAGVAVVPPLVTAGSWTEWLYKGLVVLVKGGICLEEAGRLKAFAIDKTGTLTLGQPEVQEIVPLSGHDVRELLERAAALEASSEHPIARAILRRAEAEGVDVRPVDSFRAIAGKGAEATIDGRMFWIGSHRLMLHERQETEEVTRRALELEDAGHSVVAIGNDDHVCGLISVADGVREEARAAVRALGKLGVGGIVMLTGDNEGTAAAVAAATGVDEFRAELLPEDKVEIVESLVREHGHVAMVGDGVNDAPAMAASTLGIAMGAIGTDAAIETADVALMSDDLSKLAMLVRHSRRTLRVIKQNIGFALGLKLVFIVLALFGVATLWMAIAADMGASLLVIANGLRLLRVREYDLA